MTINYYNAESLIPVEPIDLSHPKYVFLRKDIGKHTRKGFDEETEQEYWSYKEARLTKEEYEEYLESLNLGDVMRDVDELKNSSETLKETTDNLSINVDELIGCILEMSEIIYE